MKEVVLQIILCKFENYKKIECVAVNYSIEYIKIFNIFSCICSTMNTIMI